MWTERSRWYETRTVRATVFGARVRLQRPTAETSAAGVRRYVATASKRLQARVESPPGGSASATTRTRRTTRCCVGFLRPLYGQPFGQCCQEWRPSRLCFPLWRSVQAVGLQAAYTADEHINRIMPQDDGTSLLAGGSHSNGIR